MYYSRIFMGTRMVPMMHRGSARSDVTGKNCEEFVVFDVVIVN